MKSRVARVGKEPCWGAERPWPSWLVHRPAFVLPADTRTWVTVLAVLFHSTMSAPVSRTGDSSSSNDHPLWVNPCNLPDDASGHADHLSPQDVRNMLDAVANRARVASEEADKAKRRFVSTRAIMRDCPLCVCVVCCVCMLRTPRRTRGTDSRAPRRWETDGFHEESVGRPSTDEKACQRPLCLVFIVQPAGGPPCA
ncbi:hypothetical protein HPB49_022114 [Dermacentor silvarum]|uniref:Uncharacterized protein n=1 Tax=Dermacentor silvarum TaxID=543639 RepID=A0ACB8E3G3_DERSI|nr:hypothetical protein HPB49_022114 [Dermacentor silvarum]